ncbi:hypothetical protein Ddc_05724 [Ditylenchus destructor]|nr:hypothetical protein Ddc_05724 [Ditylenchus destructor]
MVVGRKKKMDEAVVSPLPLSLFYPIRRDAQTDKINKLYYCTHRQRYPTMVVCTDWGAMTTKTTTPTPMMGRIDRCPTSQPNSHRCCFPTHPAHSHDDYED